MKRFILGSIKKLYRQYRLTRLRKYALITEGANLSAIKLEPLTKDEKVLLKQQWGRLGLNIYEDIFKLYKTINKFDARYLSDDLYYPYILRKLNPQEFCVAMCHKAFYEKFFPGATQPTTYAKRIRGVFYDQANNVISEKDAKDIVVKVQSFIIKPTTDTCVGKNVHKITDPATSNLSELFSRVGQDFIIQEVVEQSTQAAELNPSSLNTIRISTLYLNGKFSVCSIVVKMGRDGSCVDNLGAGGLIIGVHNDGKLYDFAYDNKYNKYFQNGDCIFKGKQIDGIDKAIKFVERLHTSHLPHLSFVGWDIAINKYNEPVLIEANLKWPGIHFEQLCSGLPLFGDRTDEVIDYCING